MSTFNSKTLSFIFPLIILITISSFNVSAHNVTEILDSEPTLSEFNNYLTQTELADEINSRSPTTILALTNSAMSSLTSNLSISAIKNILSVHILLDYFDDIKLHYIDNNATVTTLYQTTGVAEGQTGRINIIRPGEKIFEFVSAQSRYETGPKYVKEIRTIPYNISILQISSPIIVPTLLTPEVPDNKTANLNVTQVLLNAGMKTFASLLKSTGVLKGYISQITNNGEITIFAPSDGAFKAKGMPDVNKLSNADIVSLLQFHALNFYASMKTLKSSKGELKTLAPVGKFGLTVSSIGNVFTLHTGVVDVKVMSPLFDDNSHVVIYWVDRLLLPEEIYVDGKIPSPESESPKKAPVDVPSLSPPAPSSKESPASGGGDDDDVVGGGEDDYVGNDGGAPEKSDDGDDKNSGVTRNVSFMAVVLLVISFVI